MSKSINGHKIYDLFICVALVCATVTLCIFPSESVKAAKDGLSLCGNVIVPSLFPFFVLSNLTISLGISKYLGKLLSPIMKPLFNVRGECSTAVVLGFIGGYPIGAKTALSLYQNGICSKSETERLLSFCNNSGPAFILGVVGAGIFSSSKIGLLLYLVHALASFIVGILFRNWGKNEPEGSSELLEKPYVTSFSSAFVSSITSAAGSIVSICGFVIFFTVVIKMLFLSGILPAISNFLGTTLSFLGFSSELASSLLTGIIELSSGVWSLNGVSIKSAVAMAAFMLGWAGISVHFQTLSFIGESDLSVKSYVLGKFCHGGVSAMLIFLFNRFYPLDSPVAAYLVEQVDGISSLDFSTSLLISITSASLVAVIFALICFYYVKKGGNRVKSRL